MGGREGVGKRDNSSTEWTTLPNCLPNKKGDPHCHGALICHGSLFAMYHDVYSNLLLPSSNSATLIRERPSAVSHMGACTCAAHMGITWALSLPISPSALNSVMIQSLISFACQAGASCSRRTLWHHSR